MMKVRFKYLEKLVSTGMFLLFFWNCSSDSSKESGINPSPVNNTLTVNIAAPEDNQTFAQHEIITFNGTAVYGANAPLAAENLTWMSDKDGIIGVGSGFKRSGLSVNDHTITLIAVDASGNQATVNRQLTVNNNTNGLAVLIDLPAAGVRIKSHELVRLEGIAFDSRNNPVNESLSYQWESDLNGVLGNGAAIEPGGLTPGLHHITLTASLIDSIGNSVQNTAMIEFLVELDNDPGIQAQILAPSNGYQHPVNQPITFSGAASEPNGDPIALNNIVWTSGMDGEVGRGESCVVPGLSAGIHRITMTVTGVSGKKNTTSVIIVITK
jgi:hypothetical protein